MKSYLFIIVCLAVVYEGIPAIVERVWEHFVFEQLEP
jgi:hypothetical protein